MCAVVFPDHCSISYSILYYLFPLDFTIPSYRTVSYRIVSYRIIPQHSPLRLNYTVLCGIVIFSSSSTPYIIVLLSSVSKSYCILSYHSNASAERAGSVSCYPAAFADLPADRSIITVIVEACPRYEAHYTIQ
jgi:hypothetical protein